MINRRTTKIMLALMAVVGLMMTAGPGHAEVGLDGEQVAKPVFTVKVEPDKASIGTPVTITMDVAYPVGTRVYFPEQPVVEPFMFISKQNNASAVLGSQGGESHVIKVLPVRLGLATIKPMEVPWVAPDGTARVSMTPEVKIDVQTTIGDDLDVGFKPAGSPLPVRVRNWLLIWTLVGLAIAAVTALIAIAAYRAYRAYKEAHRPPPPPRPPREIAMERLDALEAKGLVEKGESKELALEVSEIIRDFLGGTFGFSGTDMTSWEVLRLLDGVDMGRLTLVELEDYLGLCDLVKFAKFQPSPEESNGLIRRAREIVAHVPERTSDRATSQTGGENAV